MENQKLTQEEIQQLNTLQQKRDNLMFELSQIGIIKLNLQSREDRVKEFHKELIAEETSVGQQLNEKYGDGNLNLETGEFVPVLQEAQEAQAAQ
jgi:hypothetical protein